MDEHLREFAAAVHRPEPEIDLGRAALLIAKAEYPELDVGSYLVTLNGLADLAGAEGRGANSLRRLHRLRRFLFETQGFVGNTQEYFDPKNSFLNEVLDRKVGIPITLSLVVIEVGRRLGLAIEGIGLPGHFVVGFRSEDGQVLFDPFHGGALLTHESCHEVVSRAVGHPVTLTDEHFAPVTKRQLLTRLLYNLKAIYWRTEEWDKARGVLDRLLVLDPDSPEELRDRGQVWVNLGEFQRGMADWERYLREYPEAPDTDSVLTNLRRVRQALAALN